METIGSLSEKYCQCQSPSKQVVVGLGLHVIGKPMGAINIDENLIPSLIEYVKSDQVERVSEKIEGVYLLKNGTLHRDPPTYHVQRDKFLPFVEGKVIEVRRAEQSKLQKTTISMYLRSVLNYGNKSGLIDVIPRDVVKQTLNHFACGEVCNEGEVQEKYAQYVEEVKSAYKGEFIRVQEEIEKTEKKKKLSQEKRDRIVWVIYESRSRKHLCISEANKNALEKIADLTYKIRKARKELAEMRKERDEASAKVATLFEEKELHAICKDDIWFYKMKPRTFPYVDGKRLKADHPEIFAEYGEDRAMWAGVYTMTDDWREQIKEKLQGEDYVHKDKYGRIVDDEYDY